MTEEPKITVIVDSIEQRPDIPELDERIRCPDHPKARVESHYGLAGGGIGVYTYCEICCRILSKTQDKDE